MKLILLGPPGSGKGTQASLLQRKFRIPKISTGDILRSAVADKTNLGEEAKIFMDQGQLVPDEIVIGLIKKRINEADCDKGFILDGFPRNTAQAESLDSFVKDIKAVSLEVPESVSIERMLNRKICTICGHNFNTKFNPPKKLGICDYCGNKLTKRADDTKKAIKTRLQIYRNNTEPLLKRYKAKKINGNQPLEKITKKILSVLDIS